MYFKAHIFLFVNMVRSTCYKELKMCRKGKISDFSLQQTLVCTTYMDSPEISMLDTDTFLQKLPDWTQNL